MSSDVVKVEKVVPIIDFLRQIWIPEFTRISKITFVVNILSGRIQEVTVSGITKTQTVCSMY